MEVRKLEIEKRDGKHVIVLIISDDEVKELEEELKNEDTVYECGSMNTFREFIEKLKEATKKPFWLKDVI